LELEVSATILPSSLRGQTRRSALVGASGDFAANPTAARIAIDKAAAHIVA